MKRFAIVLLILFVLVGCAIYYHRFDLTEENPQNLEKYSIAAEAQPSGHGENTDKHMRNRKFDIGVSLSLSISGMNHQIQEIEGRKLDMFFGVDTIYVEFDNDLKLRPLAVEEVTTIGGIIDVKHDYGAGVFRKIYEGTEFTIPDSVKNIQLTVPYHSTTLERSSRDTLKLTLQRTIEVQKYYFAP
jgi:hypothetical protein